MSINLDNQHNRSERAHQKDDPRRLIEARNDGQAQIAGGGQIADHLP